jgi:uncharacterized protein with gpF-like domain
MSEHEPPQPKRAMEFLDKKIDVPTDRWDDLKHGEHAHAFTVAHSCEADILNDIHGFLNKALANGEAYGTFKKEMLSLMAKKGWYGGAGHGKDEKKYINWRLRVMYETNMKTAYAQAQYRKQLQGAEMRPVWVYNSKLAGNNRRQEHVALHNKAFRYDDPFWDSYYPPNGWGCQCFITTKSEAGAARDGIEIESSNSDGVPPSMTDKKGNPVDWEKFADPTWKYNVGREALAPNFNKYTNLSDDTLKQVYAKYRQSMDKTKMTKGEFKTLIKRTNEADYKFVNANYQVGNLDADRFDAMRKKGVPDSKIMTTDKQLWHGTGDKIETQKVPERLFEDLYELLQSPEMIFEKTLTGKQYREFHFVKDTKDGNKLKVVLHMRKIKGVFTALLVRTMGYANYAYVGAEYEKIW